MWGCWTEVKDLASPDMRCNRIWVTPGGYATRKWAGVSSTKRRDSCALYRGNSWHQGGRTAACAAQG
jgi:hypothetical protein